MYRRSLISDFSRFSFYLPPLWKGYEQNESQDLAGFLLLFFQGFIFNLLLGRHNLKGKIIESRRSGYGGDDSHGISHLGHGLEEPCRAPVVFLFDFARFLDIINLVLDGLR